MALPQHLQNKLEKKYPSSKYKIIVSEVANPFKPSEVRVDYRVAEIETGTIVNTAKSMVVDGKYENPSWSPPSPAQVPQVDPPPSPPAKKEKEPRGIDDPPQQFKKAKDLGGLKKGEKKILEEKPDQEGEGVAGASLLAPKPTFNKLESETMVDSKANAQIVMGPYRPAGRFGKRLSGGETDTATIDLVAGRLGSYATSVVNRGGKETAALVDNNYKVDAARVVICQKGDVDDDFGIRPGKAGTSRARSFVAAKADDIRFSARESIKLVTGTDDENAQGGVVDNPRGIDLIAGNLDHDLQPMIKGSNLVECLDDINDNMASLNGILLDFMTQQMIFNSVLAFHTHVTGVGPTTPSFELLFPYFSFTSQISGTTFTSILSNRLNITRNYFKYLIPKPFGDDKYICSKFNNVN